MFFTYIARCSDDTLYTGYCADMAEREKTHNERKGAKYTRARLPIKIIHSEEFQTKSDAMKREAEIKKLTKHQKEALILAKTTKSP
jgi:putative endonuclease